MGGSGIGFTHTKETRQEETTIQCFFLEYKTYKVLQGWPTSQDNRTLSTDATTGHGSR